MDIPYATPLMYQMDAALEPLKTELAMAPLKSGWYVGDPNRVQKEQVEIREQIDCRVARDEGEEPPDCPITLDDEEEDEPCFIPDTVFEGGAYDEAEWVCASDGEEVEEPSAAR